MHRDTPDLKFDTMDVFVIPDESSYNVPFECGFDDHVMIDPVFEQQLFGTNIMDSKILHNMPNKLGQLDAHQIPRDSRVETQLFRSKSSRDVLVEENKSCKKSRTSLQVQKQIRRTKSADHTSFQNAFEMGSDWINDPEESFDQPMQLEASEEEKGDSSISSASSIKAKTKSSKEYPEYNIDWDAIDIKEEIKHVLKTQVPKPILEDLLTQGEAAFTKHADKIRHLSKDQQEAIRYIRKKTRAERKSRREKIRRIHVNGLLETLASTLELDSETRDMASVLSKAIDFVNYAKQEIRVLKSVQIHNL